MCIRDEHEDGKNKLPFNWMKSVPVPAGRGLAAVHETQKEQNVHVQSRNEEAVPGTPSATA